MEAKEILQSLPQSHQLAFMTTCLSRAVALSQSLLKPIDMQMFQLVIDLSWRVVEGKGFEHEVRNELHVNLLRLGNRTHPLEKYWCANDATFILGAIINPKAYTYSSRLLDTVPNILRASMPIGLQEMELTECEWQLRTLKRLQEMTEPPTRHWFDDQTFPSAIP